MEDSRFDQPQSRKSHLDQSEAPNVQTKRFSQSKSRFQIKSLLAFSLVAGMSMFCQSALSMYNKSTMTSLERQFGISSSSTGLIASSFNIGNLLLTLPVSLFILFDIINNIIIKILFSQFSFNIGNFSFTLPVSLLIFE